MMARRARDERSLSADRRLGAEVRHLSYSGDDESLAASLLSGHPGAPAALFDRYGAHVQRTLASVLGIDDELPDLLHEVFARAFAEISKLEDPARLKAWLTSIAVFTARGCIRQRRRRSWLKFWAPENLPELPENPAPLEAREAVRATYDILERLPERERIAFALRYISGQELTEVALACDVSLATIKRRLRRAKTRFLAMASHDPALVDRLHLQSQQGDSP